jgi:hypothetical protein
MISVWEKRPGRWKVSKDPKVYPTRDAAIAAAADKFEIVTVKETLPEEPAVEPVVADPLDALKEARIKRDADIQERFDYHEDSGEPGFSESSD